MTRDQIHGGILGMLVGDALGVPYEFHDPRNLPSMEDIDMTPPAGFRRAHRGTPPGTWSDDGALALCLLASLLNRDTFDPSDLAERFVAWVRQGYMAVDGRVFDIGNQTSDSLYRLERGIPPLNAGGDDEFSNGNGSLMRVLPLALWHRGDDTELINLAAQQSRLTHGHARSRVCCALYCLWARRIIEGASDPWTAAVRTLRMTAHGEMAHELRRNVDVDFTPAGSGYVVDCLHTARAAMREDTYERVVQRAIAFGQDTDTSACVAGGLAGLKFGAPAIPRHWMDALRGRALVDPLLDGLTRLLEA